MKITSYWQAETGYFDSKINRYIRHKVTDIKEKELEVIIKPSAQENKPILQFIGGPTGFESYYLNSLIKVLEDNANEINLTICGGTINSWPRCWVKIADLKEIINNYLPEKIENERQTLTPHWTDSHITPGYFAWDETGAYSLGCFKTKKAARQALIDYEQTLNKE